MQHHVCIVKVWDFKYNEDFGLVCFTCLITSQIFFGFEFLKCWKLKVVVSDNVAS